MTRNDHVVQVKRAMVAEGRQNIITALTTCHRDEFRRITCISISAWRQSRWRGYNLCEPFLRAILQTTVGSGTRAMEENGRQKGSEFQHQGKFLHNYYNICVSAWQWPQWCSWNLCRPFLWAMYEVSLLWLLAECRALWDKYEQACYMQNMKSRLLFTIGCCALNINWHWNWDCTSSGSNGRARHGNSRSSPLV